MSHEPPPTSAAPVAPPRTLAPEPRGISSTVWLVILVSLAALGFFGYRAYYDGTIARLLGGQPPAAGEVPAPSHPAMDAGARAAATTDAQTPHVVADSADAGTTRAAMPPVRAAGDELTADELRFGRVEAGIADTTVPVSAEQGLLVVEVGPGGPAQVFVDDRDVGAAPVRLALSAGPHEISFRRGEDSSFRFLNIRAAHTHTVATP